MFFAPVRHQGGAVGQDKRTTMTASVTQEQMWQNVFHYTLTVPLIFILAFPSTAICTQGEIGYLIQSIIMMVESPSPLPVLA